MVMRTDFHDNDSWEMARAAALAENRDGFRAYVQVVDDPRFVGATWQALRQEAMR
jgi:hypothetical protein